ncbi:MAG TPA: hypothetical protein VI874_01865 [Candidatus Norongarragalinales archaeon]|nr:hypothetical protein [Candidatus Norongarragalinales archaeon]
MGKLGKIAGIAFIFFVFATQIGAETARSTQVLPQVLLSTRPFTYSLSSNGHIEKNLDISRSEPVLYTLIPDGTSRRNFVPSDFAIFYGHFIRVFDEKLLETSIRRTQKLPAHYAIPLSAKFIITPAYFRSDYHYTLLSGYVPSTPLNARLAPLELTVPLPQWKDGFLEKLTTALGESTPVKRYYARKKIEDAKPDGPYKIKFRDLTYFYRLDGYTDWLSFSNLKTAYSALSWDVSGVGSFKSFEDYIAVIFYLGQSCYVHLLKDKVDGMAVLTDESAMNEFARKILDVAKKELKNKKLSACPVYAPSTKEAQLLKTPRIRAELDSDRELAFTDCTPKGCSAVTSTDYRAEKTLATKYSLDRNQKIAVRTDVQAG